MTVRVGVVQFPGSNCEHDVVEALDALGAEASVVWHGDRSLGSLDGVVLPGGFAHGDYLRPGAIARFSPIMTAVASFAEAGGPVVGICNGFQVLTEAHLLPGALQKNRGLTFLCTTVEVEVAGDRSALTTGVPVGTRLRIPINHFEGNYTCDAGTLAELQGEGRIVLRYLDNPNGSVDAIRRDLQRRGQRGRADAPSRARHRPAPRLYGRARPAGGPVGCRRGPDLASGSGDAGPAQDRRVDAGRPPGRIGQTLAFPVALGRGDERVLESLQVDGAFPGRQFGLKVELLLSEMHPSERIGSR